MHWSELGSMARPLRIQFAGGFYHVMARGNERRAIFQDDFDRRAFLDQLWRVCDRLTWRVWSYCLMNNHYHLLVETQRPTLARGMRDINGVYAQAYNRRHDRVGHLFQGRYVARLVQKESYLLVLTRYIALNPVRAGLCTRPDEWLWSSYGLIARNVPLPDRLAGPQLLAMFGFPPSAARLRFQEFVRAGIGTPGPTSKTENRLFIGDDEFVAEMKARVKAMSLEVPRIERTWKPLDEYKRECGQRDEAIRRAYASGTYTLAAIADHFGLHYATVSRIAKRTRRADKTRPRQPDVAKQDLTPDG
jgi:REP element-mobilizing transposase RayT